MKAIVTLVHGTWARDAAWIRPDSALCKSIHQAAVQNNIQIEFRSLLWSGSNSVRARQEAAQSITKQLKNDLILRSDASHFVVAHSHGGNIVVDALRNSDVGERISGVVTMSTPFISCRRSGIRMVASVIATALYMILSFFLYGILSYGLFWLWYKATMYLSSAFLFWPLTILLGFLAFNWSRQIAKIPNEAVSKVFPSVWQFVEEWQDFVLDRFGQRVKFPIPILCVRFRMDEAMLTIQLSRLIIKPARILSVVSSWLAAGGVIYVVLMWPIELLSFISDSLRSLFGWIHLAAVLAIWIGTFTSLLLSIVWLIFGYALTAIVLGHWGGIIDQLLVDFYVTPTPEGADVVSKGYSPFRWRRTLLHSLTYGDRNALDDISRWIIARTCEEANLGNAVGAAACQA